MPDKRASELEIESRRSRSRFRLTNLLIVESLAVEDVTKVVSILVSVGQAAVGSAVLDVSVLATRAPWDDGSSHLLDGADTSKGLRAIISQEPVSRGRTDLSRADLGGLAAAVFEIVDSPRGQSR